MIDLETTPMITPSEVLEHIWCPRFTYYMNVLMIPQYEDRRYKVLKGREVHQRRERENQHYLRKKIGAVKKESSVYLASPTVRVRGIVDEVLTLSDKTMAPLDFKFTPYRENAFQTHMVQVGLYGILIREIYGADVTRGFVAYIRSGSKLVEVPLTLELERLIIDAVVEIFQIIKTGVFPKRTMNRSHCVDCCYKNICV